VDGDAETSGIATAELAPGGTTIEGAGCGVDGGADGAGEAGGAAYAAAENNIMRKAAQAAPGQDT